MTGVGGESEEIDKINRKEQDGSESDKSETDERDQIEIPGLLKRIDCQKKEMMMIYLILILIERKIMNNKRT